MGVVSRAFRFGAFQPASGDAFTTADSGRTMPTGWISSYQWRRVERTDTMSRSSVRDATLPLARCRRLAGSAGHDSFGRRNWVCAARPHSRSYEWIMVSVERTQLHRSGDTV